MFFLPILNISLGVVNIALHYMAPAPFGINAIVGGFALGIGIYGVLIRLASVR